MKNMNEMEYWDAVEDIKNKFNFEAIRKLMSTLDWTWSDESTPSRKNIIETAIELFTHLWEEKVSKNEYGSIGTSGFDCVYSEDGISLNFTVQETHWF